MGQVNMSLSDETKARLAQLQEYYHCASISETVTRLAWQAQENIDKHAAAFDAVKLQLRIDNIAAMFQRAFMNNNIFSADELVRYVHAGCDLDEKSIMVWGTKNSRLCILSVNEGISFNDVVNEYGHSWANSSDATILALDGGRVRFEPILANVECNRFGESMPASTGLSFAAPIGFSVVRYETADSDERLDKFDYIWDADNKAFMIRF